MTSGGLCVMMGGAVLMPLQFAGSWDMHTLEVSTCKYCFDVCQTFVTYFTCDTGGTPYYNAYFGGGTGPIFLDDVACTSSASQLLECSSSPVLAHNCDHNADAGVGCEGIFCCCCVNL